MDYAVRQTIQKLAGTYLKNDIYASVATVNSVDISTRSCTVTTVSSDAAITIEGVLLMAAVDDGVLLIPTVDSTVMISFGTYTPAFITLYSQIDKVILVAGKASIDIADDKIVFNDGTFGGIVKVQELVEKLNNLENLVNDFIEKYNSHTHPVSGGSTLMPMIPETGTLTPTMKSDIENTNVTHG